MTQRRFWLAVAAIVLVLMLAAVWRCWVNERLAKQEDEWQRQQEKTGQVI
jgi:membrane protein implicated in regulation of membrane protease activity